jgi:hypothetical protein
MKTNTSMINVGLLEPIGQVKNVQALPASLPPPFLLYDLCDVQSQQPLATTGNWEFCPAEITYKIIHLFEKRFSLIHNPNVKQSDNLLNDLVISIKYIIYKLFKFWCRLNALKSSYYVSTKLIDVESPPLFVQRVNVIRHECQTKQSCVTQNTLSLYWTLLHTVKCNFQ